MRGYEEDSYADYDEYEEDGYGHEEGDYEDDEYEEEEEERKPTKEESEYLELRQKLKESIRKKMKKAASGSQELKKDNYGSFFGPSKPVIAPRVIQESKSLLENKDLATRILKAQQNGNKSSSKPSGSKTAGRPQAPRVTELKRRAQKIKATRDYSFLLSDDAELPASPKKAPIQSNPSPGSDARLAKHSSQGRQGPGSNGRHINDGCDERRSASSNGHSNPRPTSSNGYRNPGPGSSVGHNNHRPSSGNGLSHSRLGSGIGHSSRRLGSANGQSNTRPSSGNGHSNTRPSSSNGHSNPRPSSSNGHSNPRPSSYNGHGNSRPASSAGQSILRPGQNKFPSSSKPQVVANRKQLGSNSGDGPGRPAVLNGLLQKKAIPPPQRSYPQGLKSPVAGGTKPQSAKMQSASKHQVEMRRDAQSRVLSKTRVALAKPKVPTQMEKPRKQISCHNRPQDQRPKKRPSRPFQSDDEEDDPISEIRKMFRYNPRKFAGRDEDDSDMEANYDDIQREERISERIARKEDEEELRLIEEEERRERERMRKKRKVG